MEVGSLCHFTSETESPVPIELEGGWAPLSHVMICAEYSWTSCSVPLRRAWTHGAGSYAQFSWLIVPNRCHV